MRTDGQDRAMLSCPPPRRSLSDDLGGLCQTKALCMGVVCTACNGTRRQRRHDGGAHAVMRCLYTQWPGECLVLQCNFLITHACMHTRGGSVCVANGCVKVQSLCPIRTSVWGPGGERVVVFTRHPCAYDVIVETWVYGLRPAQAAREN